MKFWRSIFAAVLLCVLSASPALACATALSGMNKAEMSCCKRMAGDCGAMKNAEHSCCKKPPSPEIKSALISALQQNLIIVAIAITPGSAVIAGPASASRSNIFTQAHSPPLPSGASLVLRI